MRLQFGEVVIAEIFAFALLFLVRGRAGRVDAAGGRVGESRGGSHGEGLEGVDVPHPRRGRGGHIPGRSAWGAGAIAAGASFRASGGRGARAVAAAGAATRSTTADPPLGGISRGRRRRRPGRPMHRAVAFVYMRLVIIFIIWRQGRAATACSRRSGSRRGGHAGLAHGSPFHRVRTSFHSGAPGARPAARRLSGGPRESPAAL